MPARMLFYWCHTTSRQPFETGIPRVVRRLAQALVRAGVAVVPLGRNDRTGLIEIIGRGSAAFTDMLSSCGGPHILLIPDLTVDLVAIGVDPISVGQSYGMSTIILVHDLIPLKLSSHYAPPAVAAFTAYYESVARADAVLTTTRLVSGELRHFLEGRSLRVPPISVVPLPAQFGTHPRVIAPKSMRRADQALKLATIASWERRKNLLALLRSLEQARRACQCPIELTLVGLRGADPTFDAEIDVLLATTPNVMIAGSLSDAALAALIASCDATVYPSLEEGFGLPVGESLWLGRPCLCHNASSMAEIAPGGGALMIDMRDEVVIGETLVNLAEQPGLLGRLSNEAHCRPLASWADYASAIFEVLPCLRKLNLNIRN